MAELLGALLLLKARRETRHGRRREQQVNRKGTLEQIIVIDASFPPSLYIYLSISLSLSLPARDIPVATFLALKFYLQWYL
jgi:hypothetical protein